MTANNQTGKRSFGRRLLWVIWKTIVTLLLGSLLAFGIFWGVTETSRSFDSITARIEANKQRVELLNDEVAGLKELDSTGKIDDVQAEVNELASQLTTAQEQITTDLSHQSEMLTTLQDEVTAATSGSATAVADTATLGDAMVALQNDINESNLRIDNLGGEVDGIRAETETISSDVGELGQVAETAVSATEIDTLQQTLSLFQVWEQIARARLHLSESNVGLAVNDVENALRLMDILVAISAEEDTESLELVQTRLALAFNSLPDDAETAVRDLENAWSQLDILITTRLLPEAGLLLNTAEETTTDDETTTGDDEAAPAESATPEASPTPEATATPSS